MVQRVVMAMLMATRLSRADAGELTPPPPPPPRLGPPVLMLLKRADEGQTNIARHVMQRILNPHLFS